jgi:hypothetical protein
MDGLSEPRPGRPAREGANWLANERTQRATNAEIPRRFVR